jgi:hypothetical protein
MFVGVLENPYTVRDWLYMTNDELFDRPWLDEVVEYIEKWERLEER